MGINILKIRRFIGYYVLLLPTYVLMSVFSFVPFTWAFTKSFYQFEIGEAPVFVGLQNYIDYLHDPTLLASFGNMIFLTIFAVGITICVPLTIARLIFSLSSEKARYIYRILFLIPIVVPGVAIYLIWGGMIYSDQGLLNEFLRLLHLGGLTRGWLSDPQTVLWAIAFIGFPWANGITILIYYAGFAAIPESVYEAAELDGATGVRRFFIIDIPLIMSQIKLLVILVIIGGIQGFEGIFIITRGGPGFKSMVPGLWMYFNAFSFQNMGVACAIGVILFLIILLMTIINLKYVKSSEELQGFGR